MSIWLILKLLSFVNLLQNLQILTYNFLPLTHFDDGEKSTNKPFGCALVVGIDRAPRKVTKAMGAKRVARRSQIKPFMKVINYSHIMPTRYSFDAEMPASVNVETLKDAAAKKEAKKEVRKILEEKYKTGENKWFFQKLRF